jgi:hypothetical protein
MILFYTSLKCDVFDIVIRLLEPFKYYGGWQLTSLELFDQVLMTLMKLKHNLRDIDLAYKCSISKATVYNVVKHLIRLSVT